jgi:hypothetical protein
MCDLFAMLQQRYGDFSSEINDPLFLCLCIYSISFLTVPIFLFWPHFRFDMALFGLFV